MTLNIEDIKRANQIQDVITEDVPWWGMAGIGGDPSTIRWWWIRSTVLLVE